MFLNYRLGIILALVFTFILSRVQNNDAFTEEECLGHHENYVTKGGSHGSSILRRYTKFSVAADSEFCSIVGADILRADGSAVDAAIATGLCNGISHSQSSGIGGGHFMVIYLKDKNAMYAIDARETAPLSSDLYMFANKSSTKGGMSSAIPGEIAGFWEAHKLGGKLPWKRLFEPAIKMCRNGFKVTDTLAKVIKKEEASIRADIGLSQVYLNKQTGQIFKEKDIIRNPNLARTLEMISEENVQGFYNGRLTQTMVDEMNEMGARVTLEDFSNYQALVKKPIVVNLKDGFKILSQPPPSSGILVSFIVNLMSRYNLNNETLVDPESRGLFYHRLVEVFKHSYYFRSMIGDENIDNDDRIREKLLDENFINEIKSKIDDLKTFPSHFYGSSVGEDTPGTSHISVLANNDAVALTTTINTFFGGKYLGQKSGIIYNNEMDDFSSPGLVNFFGFEPSVANFIKPKKRPMSSMTPTVVLDKNNDVRLVIGGSGGSKIITAVAQVIINNLWINTNIKDCIDAKRFHHQLYPEILEAEVGTEKSLRAFLLGKGHALSCSYPSSVLQGIARLGRGNIQATCDIRKSGLPDGE